MLIPRLAFIIFVLCLSSSSLRTRRNLPLEPFFELAIWAFEKHVGPVIFTGVSQKESSELAFSFIKYYSSEVTDNIIKINCSASQMDEVFRSIAEFYIKETQYEADSYEIINSLHEYFGNQNTLFILEDVDLDDKYVRKFIKVARESMLTDILVTNVQSFIRGKFILLDFEIYKTRGLMYVVRGLTADLRMKYMEDHNLNNKQKDVETMLEVYEKQAKMDTKIQQYQDPLFLKYYNKFSFKKHNLESDEDEEEEDEESNIKSNEKAYSYYLRKKNKLMKKFPKGLPKNLFQNERLNDEFRDEVISYGYKPDNNNYYNNDNNIDTAKYSRLRKSRNHNLEMMQQLAGNEPEKQASHVGHSYITFDGNEGNFYNENDEDTLSLRIGENQVYQHYKVDGKHDSLVKE